jgi:hypothetical protein
MNVPTTPSGAADFNFFPGHWKVSHRRLKQRLVGSTEWEEFGGTCSVQTLLGGFGNVDDNVIDLPGAPYRAVTFRSYDPSTQQWTIWWLDGRAPGKLDAPMVGSFKDGVGTFYGDDTLDGKPIRLRFLWTMAAPDVPRWEQAFSADGGATWETNWTMSFHRAA